jgi:hypothetical protein
MHEIENNLSNLKKRILEKNENLSNINKTGLRFNATKLRYNLEYLHKMMAESEEDSSNISNDDDDSDSSRSSQSSSDEEESPQQEHLRPNKSNHSLLNSARGNVPRTSEILEQLDSASFNEVMKNFGMGISTNLTKL